jgi:hypothetical protein
MRLVSASARVRRRLVWAASLAAIGVVGALVVLLLPSKSPPPVTAPLSTPGVGQLAAAPKLEVSAATRRAIDATLDRFIPDAVAQKNLRAAWALAGPELHSAQTFAQWRAGTTPIPYYPAAGTTFHDWQTIEVGRRYVILNILIHPTPGAKVSPYEFSGEVVERNGHWLVNRLYTIAIFNRPTKTTHEIGPADFAAPAPGGATPSGHATLGRAGIFPVVGVLLLVLLVPLSVAGIALVRARRWRRQVRAAGHTDLPPLPKRYLRERSERPESASRH